MKKLLLIIFSLTLINLEKDNIIYYDPLNQKLNDEGIDLVWFAEYDLETDSGDTAYYQKVPIVRELISTKTKYSINSMLIKEPKVTLSWKNNNPNCKPEDCTNHD